MTYTRKRLLAGIVARARGQTLKGSIAFCSEGGVAPDGRRPLAVQFRDIPRRPWKLDDDAIAASQLPRHCLIAEPCSGHEREQTKHATLTHLLSVRVSQKCSTSWDELAALPWLPDTLCWPDILCGTP